MNKMHAKAGCRLAPQSARALVAAMGKGFCYGLLAAGCLPYQAAAAEHPGQSSELRPALSASAVPAPQTRAAPSVNSTQAVTAQEIKRANFERERASHEARHVADWIVDSGDNGSLPFAIVDKAEAKVFVFDAHGRLSGAAPALLGLARGDDAVAGIGDSALSSIRPEDRTTPAGRFVADMGRNLHGKEILWVDYATAISMHPVVTSNPVERRAQRLATATPRDNRISFGCINVPVSFFENVVRPAFTGTNGIVYVLPETRPAHTVFASYDVGERVRLTGMNQALPARAAHRNSKVPAQNPRTEPEGD